MNELIPNYTPYSDIETMDNDVVSVHKELINNYKYTEATEYINQSELLKKKGFRSSFFNAIEKKIQELQIYLLNKNASPDEYYSITEPTDEEMFGKTFWIKPII